MHMRGQDERHFRVTLRHTRNYRFESQAHEDGKPHGGPYPSDEPDPVGEASGPATPALLGSAVGHCLSAALLEALRHAQVPVDGMETEVDAVVHLGDVGLPRIARLEVVLRPNVQATGRRAEHCAETFEKHCTVSSSVKQGIDVRVRVEWQMPAGRPTAENQPATPSVSD
jgi:organic hydroperoxide reductase OsmC/OhrA